MSPFLNNSLDLNSDPLCCNVVLADWCIDCVSTNRSLAPQSRDGSSFVFRSLPTTFSIRYSMQYRTLRNIIFLQMNEQNPNACHLLCLKKDQKGCRENAQDHRTIIVCLLRAYYGPGIVLSTLDALFYLILTSLFGCHVITISIP